MTATPDTEALLAAALYFASRDIPVLPLNWPVEGQCSCGRATCKSPAKHPLAKAVPHGLTDASTDFGTIRRWWAAWPNANLGVATGHAFDALDIDGDAGQESFLRLAKKYGSPHHVADVMTGREDGGLHLLTVPPGQSVNQAGGRNGMPPGLDVRGLGGYIVAPPSLHISGKRYEWGSHFADGVLLGNRDWAEWLADVKADEKPDDDRAETRFAQPTVFAPVGDAAGAYGNAVLRRAVHLVHSSVEGNRWHTLATDAIPLVARAVDGGVLDLDQAVTALEDAARDVGLDDRTEARRVRELVEKMIAKGIRQPIRPPEAAPLQHFTSVEEAEVAAWDPPEPLERDVPPFPTQVLGWLQRPVEHLSRRLQTPTDLAGMLTLALVAACVRGRARVQVVPGWDEPLNLYIAVVLASGETKSPLVAVLLKRLREKEKEKRAEAAALISARTDMHEVAMARLKKAKDDASRKGTLEAEAEVVDARRKVDEIHIPAKPLFLAGDMTPEAMVKLLAEQGGNLAHMSAEGGLLDTIIGGRYSNGQAHIADLLNAFDGREPIKVHRKSAEEITVERPLLTMGLAVQPQVLRALGESEVAMRRGLHARYLFAVPRSLVGRRDMSFHGYDADLERAFDRLTDAVLDPAFLGAFGGDTPGSSGGHGDMFLKYEFKTSSSSLLLQYREHLEPRRHRSTGDLGDLGAWINKIDGQIARLSGILQIIRDADPSLSEIPSKGIGPQNPRDVEPETVADALVLAEYLTAHAEAAHDLMAGEAADLTRAAKLFGWAQNAGKTEFSTRNAQQALKRRTAFPTVAAVQAAIDELVARGWLWPIPPDPDHKGRPASPRYLVHPDARVD